MLVRSHVRKFWTALYKEINDTNLETRIRSSNLFLMGVVFSEDYMIQFLDKFVPNLIRHVVAKQPEEVVVATNVSQCFRLIGRFCPPSSYLPLITSGLSGEYS